MGNDLNDKKKELREELDKLRYEFKVELPRLISQAREYGDLKENAEYHAARERQSFVKSRIAFLTDQLNQLNNINVSGIPEDRIAYGTRVRLINIETDDDMELEFVAASDVNPSKGKISLSSPFGVALQNREAGEVVEILIPAGTKKFYIEKITTYSGNEIEKKYSGK